MKKTVLGFFVVLALLVNSLLVFSVLAEENEEFKTLNVTIDADYHDHGRFDAEDFPELELEALYLISDYEWHFTDFRTSEVRYLFILKNYITTDEMKNFAENNPYVEAAFPGYTEPFEGTLSINVPNDKITMKVGEQLDLEVTEAKGYAPAFSFSFVQVRIDDYDETYTYEPNDFPQVALSKVEHIGNGEFYLYIKEPSFWNIIKAADALSIDGKCSDVTLMTLNYPTSIEIVWSVENSNIACFDSGENIYEGFEPKLKALKEGKTSLNVKYNNQGEYAEKTFEVEIFPGDEKDKKPVDDEEKKICNATLEDDFADDCVLVVMKKAYSEVGKKYTIDDFSEIECTDVRNLYYGSSHENNPLLNKDDFHQILKLELKIKGKKQVLDAIKILEQREDILLAEPDYHITVEPGIDEVEPTATSTPSKVTSPEADDNNTILWISVISGVVIVAAVVVIVTVKKKK